ncbi:D-hexose-6-phosphate mutarotase [Agaribacterium haliotis]|uniref:D-hexose-6-phosphate mutarotase n=1 Tax=Agaribacterium haliotis TaxID=2013869 RepID=UPI001303FAEB|nr:D-hexose-6-phosphate mutarotase [Agaribacterium haliotis]
MTYSELSYGEDSLRIYHQGAHLSSWNCNGAEQLFLSEQSAFAKGKAIRGGVPLIFPQFAAIGDGVRHGFLRSANWQLDSRNENSLSFVLHSDQNSLELWPGQFSAKFTAELTKNRLKMQLQIKNIGTQRFDFAAALHSYFAIDDLANTKVFGLKGFEYWDNGNDFKQRHKEQADELRVDAAIDRMYFNVNKDLKIVEPNRTRVLKNTGFSEVVVWNPWSEGAAELADMADKEYLNMLCVEAALVDPRKTLEAGESWFGEQLIELHSLKDIKEP